MNTRKGFIQISLLVVIIASVLVVGGIGYFGPKQYQSYQAEKIEKAKIAQEKERVIKEKEKEAQMATEAQQKALEVAQSEIEKLKSENDITKKKQTSLEKKIEQTNTNKNISSGEDDSYSKIPVSSVVQLFCTQNINGIPDLNTASSGSGTFVDSGSGLILTNAHVVNNNFETTCAVLLRDIKNSSKPRMLFAKVFALVENSDAAFLKPQYLMIDEQGNFTDGLTPIPDNYPFPQKSSSCKDADIKLGSKLVVVGYPMVGGKTVTLTEGIVSGFDGDYIKTSAKIEAGNSGGGAFLIPSGCWIGIPSASVVGGIESLGRILRWDA